MPLYPQAVDLPAWAQLVEKLGFPVATALILLGGAATLFFAGLKAARWFGAEIIVPLRDAHTNFLKNLEDTQLKQAATLEGVNGNLGKLTALQEQHNEETQYIRQLLEKNGRA